MMRVCPKRDALCPHGMDCPYVGEYDCTEPVRALSAVGQKAGTVEDRNVENSGYYYQHTPISVASAALIHAPSVAEAAEPVAWIDLRNEPAKDWKTRIVATNPEYVKNNGAANFARLFTHPASSPVVPSGLEALVERFSLSRVDGMFPNSDGEWVRTDAIAALIAGRDMALREIAFLKAANASLSRENALNQRMFHEASSSAETAERALTAALNRIAEIEGERDVALLRDVFNYIEDEQLRDPDLAHHNDRERIQDHNAAQPVLLERLAAAIRSRATKQEKAE